MQRVGFSISGLPGSGSTTTGKDLAKVFGLPPPFYSGGVARCLAEKRERMGEKALVAMQKGFLKAVIVDMMRTGEVPPRPNIAADYATFPREFDLLIDEVQQELLEHESTKVHEGRMVPHLVKRLQDEGRAADKLFIKIFCIAEAEERIRRLQTREEYRGMTLDYVRQETEKRLAIERRRYQELYSVEDHIHLGHFDIIHDTTLFSPEEGLVELLRKVENLHPGLLAQFIPEK